MLRVLSMDVLCLCLGGFAGFAEREKMTQR